MHKLSSICGDISNSLMCYVENKKRKVFFSGILVFVVGLYRWIENRIKEEEKK